MVVNGYLVVWALMFLVMSLMMKWMVKQDKNGVGHEGYYQNTLGIFLINTLIALTLVYTVLSIVFDFVHWYWTMLGTIVTIVVGVVMFAYVKIGRSVLEQELTEKEKERVKELGIQNIERQITKSKGIFAVAVGVNIAVYVVIGLNAWDIVPFRETLFPPMMPVYVHIMLDWFQLMSIFTFNFLVLVAMKRWMVYQKMHNKITNRQLV